MTSLLSARPAVASFAKFVLLGGGVGLASSVAVPLTAAVVPWVVANALITVASTALGTELHARFTFGAGRHAAWRQHLQSAGSATAAYLMTSAAILTLHAVQPSAGMRWEQAVYLGASGLAGIGRFLVLRLFVFARGRTAGTVQVAATRFRFAVVADADDLSAPDGGKLRGVRWPERLVCGA
jgi:putative flippase GtrA